VFEEKVSGAARQRPALEQLLREMRADDVLVVTRLDRLARSTAELLRIAEAIAERSGGLQSLEEPWADTTTPAGRMVLTVFAGVAEFERALIRQRTDEGLALLANFGPGC
jgi:DNA invertase Pin-like site-specific DNA recombinase